MQVPARIAQQTFLQPTNQPHGQQQSFFDDCLTAFASQFCDETKSATVTCIKHVTGLKGHHGDKPMQPSAGGGGGGVEVEGNIGGPGS